MFAIVSRSWRTSFVYGQDRGFQPYGVDDTLAGAGKLCTHGVGTNLGGLCILICAPLVKWVFVFTFVFSCLIIEISLSVERYI